MPRFRQPDRSVRVKVDAELDTTIGEDHLARFIWMALEAVDLSVLEAQYRKRPDGPGRPATHPRLLAALWIYGLGEGMETAAEIARACTQRDDFRWLAGGVQVSDQALLNFLQASPDGFSQLWRQVLQSLKRNRLVDMSSVFEDGSKVRANASPNSFVTKAQLEKTIADLEAQLSAAKTAAATGNRSPEQMRRDKRVQLALEDRLARARIAHAELRARVERRSEREKPRVRLRVVQPAEADRPGEPVARGPTLYSVSAFVHDGERDVLVCPQGESLAFVGEYHDHARDPSSPRYRLYQRRDCKDCPQRTKCTTSRGRRVKIRPKRVERAQAASAPPTPDQAQVPIHDGPSALSTASTQSDGPRASLTDPESVLMLATSEKRFAPSFNADITVTRDGIIVSQFLTKNPTDYPNFAIALRAVEESIGTPERWVGDGHYGSRSNLALAKTAGVLLYAPPAGEGNDGGHLSNAISFRHDAEKDVLICTEGEELRHAGTYDDERGDTYDLYSRSDCGDCARRPECTKSKGTGRRRKVYRPSALVGELEQRLAADDGALKRKRSATVEPAHAHLKMHGLARFHVRGLKRCAAALTLAATSHNLRKWYAKRETTLVGPAAEAA